MNFNLAFTLHMIAKEENIRIFVIPINYAKSNFYDSYNVTQVYLQYIIC